MNRRSLWIVCSLLFVIMLIGCSSMNSSTDGIKVSDVKNELKLGMTKSQVKQLIGRSYTNLYQNASYIEVWRFDSVAEKGYKVQVRGDSIADYDLTGLLTGKLTSQLFVSWTSDNLLKDVTLYYIVDDEVQTYHLE